MLRYVIAWGIGIIGTFGLFKLGAWFITFCGDHEDKWWGGLPLWMMGLIGVLVPLVILMVAVIYGIVHD